MLPCLFPGRKSKCTKRSKQNCGDCYCLGVGPTCTTIQPPHPPKDLKNAAFFWWGGGSGGLGGVIPLECYWVGSVNFHFLVEIKLVFFHSPATSEKGFLQRGRDSTRVQIRSDTRRLGVLSGRGEAFFAGINWDPGLHGTVLPGLSKHRLKNVNPGSK